MLLPIIQEKSLPCITLIFFSSTGILVTAKAIDLALPNLLSTTKRPIELVDWGSVILYVLNPLIYAVDVAVVVVVSALQESENFINYVAGRNSAPNSNGLSGKSALANSSNSLGQKLPVLDKATQTNIIDRSLGQSVAASSSSSAWQQALVVDTGITYSS